MLVFVLIANFTQMCSCTQVPIRGFTFISHQSNGINSGEAIAGGYLPPKFRQIKDMASQSPSLSPKLSNGIKKKPGAQGKGQKSSDDRLLPPGWAKVKSEQGAYYYWDKRSGKTSWRFPEEEGMQLRCHLI